MRDYVPKSCGLPTAIGNQVLWLVKDYDRMKTEYDNAIWDSPGPPDGQPRARNNADPTSREAMKRAVLFQKIEAVEQAKLEIPEEYREGVWNNLLYKTPYPQNADRVTYWREKSKFMRRVAQNMLWA